MTLLLSLIHIYCFGCQADGDVIDFVSHLENVSPKEAALMLAQDFSIPYEDKDCLLYTSFTNQNETICIPGI